MGQTWLQTLQLHADTELVGVVDLNVDAAEAAAGQYAADARAYSNDLSQLISDVAPDAVLDVTIPAAHHAVTVEALSHGIPVLGEKPAAETVAQALSLAAAADVAGELFMVSQSRRYDRNLRLLHDAIRRCGPVGFLTSEHFRAPRFGGFRDQMDHPFLLDMAIHPFDAARYLLDADPVAVYCEEFNPAWSWYKGAAATSAIFEMTDGKRFSYQGSWCSPGLETSWNGRWRASGPNGSALWDGEGAPAAEYAGESFDPFIEPSLTEGLAGALDEFVAALRFGALPSTIIHENIPSLAMVEASVSSALRGARVSIADVLDEAREQALSTEKDGNVRTRLADPGFMDRRHDRRSDDDDSPALIKEMTHDQD